MPTKHWKNIEREIGRKYFGCERRGADYADLDGGKDDLTRDDYSVEIKHSAQPTFGLMLAAVKQSEAAARGREPIAIIHKKGQSIGDALVVMRLDTFRDWRL